jgi:hypothetical protein
VHWDAVRARFRAAPHTLGPTPGAREAWHRGRGTYAVWLARVDTPAVRARMAEATALLAPHGLGRVFGEPHVTVFVCGFPAAAPTLDDDVAEDALRAQAGALETADAFELVVGDLLAFTSCAVLTVDDPAGGLAALRHRLAPHVPEVRFAPYEPHVTVAAFADTRPTGPVADAIDRWSPRAPLRVPVREVELVEIDPSGVDPRLRTRWKLALSA